MKILFWALAVTQTAQPTPVTETDAVLRSLRRPAVQSLLQGRKDLAKAGLTSSGIWPNPEVAYDREQMFDAASTVEEAMVISQSLTGLGQRGLWTEAGEYRVKASELQNAAQRLFIIGETKRRFYEVIYRQRRATVIARLEAKLKDALEIVKQREKAGEASRYERHRLERELRVARAEFNTEAIERETRWRELLILVPGLEAAQAWPRLSGDLLPEQAPDLSPASTKEQPSVRALGALMTAVRLEGDAAKRSWIPDLAITGGWRNVSTNGMVERGFVANLTLGIPIFNRDQGTVARTTAEADILSSKQSLKKIELSQRIDKLTYRSTEFYRSAKAFRSENLKSSGELSKIAEAAYKGGELGLLALLDAHRISVADELLLLELEHKARVARIELDVAIGASP